MKDKALLSGLPGALPVELFIEGDCANLAPQVSRVLEPRGSDSAQTLASVSLAENRQIPSTATERLEPGSSCVRALTGGMKSPCTGTPSLYEIPNSKEELEAWKNAIERDRD